MLSTNKRSRLEPMEILLAILASSRFAMATFVLGFCRSSFREDDRGESHADHGAVRDVTDSVFSRPRHDQNWQANPFEICSLQMGQRSERCTASEDVLALFQADFQDEGEGKARVSVNCQTVQIAGQVDGHRRAMPNEHECSLQQLDSPSSCKVDVWPNIIPTNISHAGPCQQPSLCAFRKAMPNDHQYA